MIKELRCHAGVGPKVTGIALVADDNFSARYDLDRIKGVFSRPQHKLAGQSYKDKILVLNTAKGGANDSFYVLEENGAKLEDTLRQQFVESMLRHVIAALHEA